MLNIRFPAPEFLIETRQGKQMIFDRLRKKWLVLTPEEWVRQNFLNFLLKEMNFPSTLIALEKQIKVGEMLKRFDILVYNQAHQPWMLIECKAPEIQLSESTLQQLLRYHISTPADYLIITNGKSTIGWGKAEQGLVLLEEFPGVESSK